MNTTKKLVFTMAVLFTVHLSFSSAYSMQTEEKGITSMLQSLDTASQETIVKMQNLLARRFIREFNQIMHNLATIISNGQGPQTSISNLYNLLRGNIRHDAWDNQMQYISKIKKDYASWRNNKKLYFEKEINESQRSRLEVMNTLCQVLTLTTENNHLDEDDFNIITRTFLSSFCYKNPRNRY